MGARLHRMDAGGIQINFSQKYDASHLQWLPFENGKSPIYVVNEVTLTGQKPSLKLC